MIIVFEGHDGSGKTTIAEALAERFETEVFMSNSKECFTDRGIFAKDSSNIATFNYYIASYVSNLVLQNKINKPIIIYRSFLSEWVYSDLLGRETNHLSNRSTDTVLKRANALVVLCKNNRDSFDDKFLASEHIKKTKDLYQYYKDMTQSNILEIDTSEKKVDEYVDRIILELRDMRENNQ